MPNLYSGSESREPDESRNPRNAGRKRQFTDDDLRAAVARVGLHITRIARELNVCRAAVRYRLRLAGLYPFPGCGKTRPDALKSV